MDENSTFVKWKEVYETGLKEIDDEHKKLVDIVNELYKTITGSDEAFQNNFDKNLQEVIDYANYHFDHEKNMMVSISYPSMIEHTNQHKDFVKVVNEEKELCKKNMKHAANKLIRYLRDWIFEHIAVYDKTMAEYVKEYAKKKPLI